MSYSRTKGEIVASGGYYVGSKGSEKQVVNSSGVMTYGVGFPVIVTFAEDSAAHTTYVSCPVTGTVQSVNFVQGTAVITTTVTVKAGSAGTNIATATMTSVAVGIAGAVALSTGGTGVTAGQVIGVARTAQATVGGNAVTINILQTA